MNDETSGVVPDPQRPDADPRWLPIAMVGGVVLAALGVVVGLVMALRRREASCPDGKYFPEGTTDFRCFVHPQALDGTAVVILSLMLGILIVVCGQIAQAVADKHRAEEA